MVTAWSNKFYAARNDFTTRIDFFDFRTGEPEMTQQGPPPGKLPVQSVIMLNSDADMMLDLMGKLREEHIKLKGTKQ